MNLYFVRHGESEANVANLRQGPHGSLSEVGREQAGVVAQRFKDIPLDLIISSPYERAKETAEILNAQLQKEMIFSDLLVERKHPGEVVDKPGDHPEVIEVLDLIDKNYHNEHWRFSDEENFVDVKQRAIRAIRYVRGLEKENIMILTHGTFIRFVVAVMMFGEGLTSHEFLRFARFVDLKNTGITLCRFKEDADKKGGGEWRMVAWNDHAHLG